MKRADVIVVGAGLAGLSCALELTSRRRGVLLLEGGRVVGGRTSSWDEGGMMVESGLHRVLGFYAAFPDLLRKAGLNVDDIVCWEDEIEIRLPDGHGSGVFGATPLYNPVGTLTGILGNFEVLSLLDRISLAGFLTAGLLEYFSNPTELDQVSVREKAAAWGVTENAIQHLLVPLTSGLYFLPPERYSAYAFLGGMTDVMAAPIAAAIGGQGRRALVLEISAAPVGCGPRALWRSRDLSP
jgi:15-cis-phytoene desaturase